MKQANITITPIDWDSKSVLLILEGKLVLGNLDQIKEQVLIAIENNSIVKIVVKNVENIDLSFIQLLFAIKKSLQTLHKQFSFEIELPEALQTILTHAGFVKLPSLLSM